MSPSFRISCVVVMACLVATRATGQNRAALEGEFERLRTELRIPTLSAAVVEGGTTVWVRHFGFKPAPGEAVRYPIGSLTMAVTSVAAMRQIESGRLALDTPVARPDGTLVQVRHLLMHTAAGDPGTRFMFSSQLYDLLGDTIARAAGTPLPAAIAAGVTNPAGLTRTIAGPGMTASAGLESTVEDLARLAAAVERGSLLSAASTAEMFRAPRAASGRAFPSALGWFVQQIGGEQVRWQFSQGPDASGLLISLPRRRLSLVVLARTDRLSAPFWLSCGDLRWSPFATAFLAAWAKLRVDLPEARRLMTQALMSLSKGERAQAVDLARKATVIAPLLVNEGDPVLLAALARSGDRDLREMGRRTAQRLLESDPHHPRTLFDLAVLNEQDRQPDEAARLLRAILAERQATPELERAVRDLLARLSPGK